MIDREPDGATPLDPDEAEGLLPAHILTRSELNEWEQRNILEATAWSRRVRATVLSEPLLREMHRRMFDRTWDWAGRYRTSDKNIGVFWAAVPTEARKLVDDGGYWLEHRIVPIDETALRLHHRMVKVHLFANGNGRHARLWCDTLLRQRGRPPMDWKNRELDHAGGARLAYIRALRAADAEDYRPLLGLYLPGRPPE
jgi:Fic-DOC domain mobile mystery protein B